MSSCPTLISLPTPFASDLLEDIASQPQCAIAARALASPSRSLVIFRPFLNSHKNFPQSRDFIPQCLPARESSSPTDLRATRIASPCNPTRGFLRSSSSPHSQKAVAPFRPGKASDRTTEFPYARSHTGRTRTNGLNCLWSSN